MWILYAGLSPYLYTMETNNALQTSKNLQSFYDFAKLERTQQTALLAKNGKVIDLDHEATTITKLYVLGGFFVEETTCKKHNIVTDIIPFKSGYKIKEYVEVKSIPVQNKALISYRIGFVKKLAMVLVILLSSKSLFSQTTKEPAHFNFGVEAFSSADGHGTFYSPHLNVTKGNNTIGIGTMIQKRTGIMNGLKLSYSRNLTGVRDEADLLQINAFGSLQYNNKLPLSYALVNHEGRIYREQQTDFNSIKMATAEVTAGFGLQVNITRTISWNSYAGLATYYHLNYAKGIDHARMATGLMIGTGINFLIF